MFKKLVVGGVIAMSLMAASVPAFAASNCPNSNAAPAYYQSCNKVRGINALKNCGIKSTTLSNLLNQLKAFCNSQKRNCSGVKSYSVNNWPVKVYRLSNSNCPYSNY
jgi:hypothetical protein